MSSLPYETTLSVVSAPDGVLDARHELPLFTSRATVPIAMRVAEACAIELGDAQGGEMVLLAVSPRGGVVHSTWSAFVAVCDYRGRTVFRAMRGSVFARAVRTAHADLVLNDGNAGLLQQQAARHFDRAQQPRGSDAGDAGKLASWARGLEAGMKDRIHLSHIEGGWGVPAELFDAGGYFLSPLDAADGAPPETPVAGSLAAQTAAIEHEIRVLSERLDRSGGAASGGANSGAHVAAALALSPPSVPLSHADASVPGVAPAGGRVSPAGSLGSRGSLDSAVSDIATSLVRAGVPSRASRVLAKAGVLPSHLPTLQYESLV